MACIIQKQIKVSDKWIGEIIKDYEGMPEGYCIAFRDFHGNRDEMIKEIKKRSKVGKQLMLMKYQFQKEFLKEIL